MSKNPANDDRLKLIDALHAAWKAEETKVREFGLQPIEAQISQEYGGWTVPVVSGVPTGSAYELARVLDRLQELVEDRSKLSISLFLDPFAKAG